MTAAGERRPLTARLGARYFSSRLRRLRGASLDSISAIISQVLGGLVIRDARRRAGLSQRELANRLGTKQSVVARWESLATSPSFEMVARACRACDFALDWRLVPIDADQERVINEQRARQPKDRLVSVVSIAGLRA
jgi:ribosome-binding protein aMBF1 (putative translation factor)